MADHDSTLYGVIYCIQNLISGKRYIGQTTTSLNARWSQHKSSGSGCRYIKASIAKYGENNFSIFEICRAFSKEELDAKELYWIGFYKSHIGEFGYNLTMGGNAGGIPTESARLRMAEAKIGKIASEETRKKMSKAKIGFVPSRLAVDRSILANKGRPLTEEHRQKLSYAHKGQRPATGHIEFLANLNRGKSRTQETKDKISDALRGKKRKQLSEEHRAKIAKTSLGRCHSDEAKSKISKARKGKPLSEEHRKKLSEARQMYFDRKRQAAQTT